MKLNKPNRITLVVLSTFAIMMAMSLITSIESIMLLMGDTKCNIRDWHYGKSEYVSEHWHYGWTHWLYIIMGACLAIVQIVRIVIILEEENE